MKVLYLRGPLCLKYKLYKYHLIIFTAVFSFCFVFVCQAQEVAVPATPAAKATNEAIDLTSLGIQIGEKVPDLTINNIHNYKSTTAKRSDFKGKLLILDFWATWCSPCVAMIPKMDSLQKEFGDKIQFLSVTYQKEKEVVPFLDKLESQLGVKIDLPFVTSDTILKKQFPHQYLPHYVWIDTTGVVRAFTSFEEINSDNILNMYKGETSIFKEKHDIVIEYDRTQSMFFRDSQVPFFYYSVISNYQQGFGNGYYNSERLLADSLSTIRITGRNLTIPQLYQISMGKGKIFRWKHTVLDVVEPDKLIQFGKSGDDHSASLKEGRGFCYEIIVPRSYGSRVYDIMNNDLIILFPNYTASVENQLRKCMVLRSAPNSNLSLLKSRGGESGLFLKDGAIELNNYPITTLVTRLNDLHQPINGLDRPNIFFIDETDFSEKIDLSIDADILNIDALRVELAKSGLLLEEEMRPIRMLVIRDSK